MDCAQFTHTRFACQDKTLGGRDGIIYVVKSNDKYHHHKLRSLAPPLIDVHLIKLLNAVLYKVIAMQVFCLLVYHTTIAIYWFCNFISERVVWKIIRLCILRSVMRI